MAKRKTITFYTQREIDVIERVVKNGKRDGDNIELLSKRLKRPLSGMVAKYGEVKKRLGLKRAYKKEGEKPLNKKSVEFPTDVTLEFAAERIMLQEGRLIVYFK